MTIRQPSLQSGEFQRRRVGHTANLAVALSTVSGKTVTVDYTVGGGTATGGGVDYTLANGTLTLRRA